MASNMSAQLRKTLDFLRGLRDNNSKQWFEEHRADYEAAREAFVDLVTELIHRFGAVDDLGGVSPRECIFRINRDLRFSKDKTPYKTAMSALLGRGGRKSMSSGRSYYFHIEPDGKSLLAGGLYEPAPAELSALRQVLAKDARPLKKIIGGSEFVRLFGSLSGESLKTAPQGCDKDHPEILLLRRKQFYASCSLDDPLVLSDALMPHALEAFAAMKPLLVYLEKAAGGR